MYICNVGKEDMENNKTAENDNNLKENQSDETNNNLNEENSYED